LLEEPLAEAQTESGMHTSQRRPERRQKTKIVRPDINVVDAAAGDVVAAIPSLAQPETGCPKGCLGGIGDRRGPHDRTAYSQLRQRNAEVAAEQPRPRTAGKHRGLASDAPFLCHDAGDAAGSDVEAAHGTVGQHLSAQPARSGGIAGAACCGSAWPSLAV